MRIIISPTKTMNTDTDSFLPESRPVFLKEAETLKTALQALAPSQLQKLWKCSPKLLELNINRLKSMDLSRSLTPAIQAFDGLQFKYMAADVLEQPQLDYLQQHLRILSGLYGILRPFDGITPYRLDFEMPLSAAGHPDLYSFWGSRLADDLASQTDFILDLASAEYSKAVRAHLPENVVIVKCVFAQLKNDRPIEKGTYCKMARGQMVRWMAEHNITRAQDIPAFDQLGYRFSAAHSGPREYVFLKESQN